MISGVYMHKLTQDERAEYRSYLGRFVSSVQTAGLVDGFDFAEKYQVCESGSGFYVARTGSVEPLGGIRSTSKGVMEALFANAAQNHGR